MRVGRFKILLLLALITIAAYPQHAAAVSYEFELGLLAVSSDEGIVVPASITLRPGRGEVSLEPADLLHPSLRVSTEVAFHIAALTAGVNPYSYSLSVRFGTDRELGGPSASAFIASSLLLVMRWGLLPRRDVSMTGMVSLTGLVVPVAGVELKAKAAGKAGFREILVPLGEEELANSSLRGSDSKAVGVCSILEAASLLGGLNGVPLPTVLSNVSLPREVLNVFARDARRFYAAIRNLSSYVEEGFVEAHINPIVSAFDDALKEDPYSAASLAFAAGYVLAANVTSTRGFSFVEEVFGVSYDEALSRARAVLANVSAELEREGACSLPSLSALAAAEVRLYLAEQARNATAPGTKVLGLMRALSAETWAKAAAAAADEPPYVPCALVADVARYLAEYAERGYEYLRSIQETSEVEIRMPDERDVRLWLEDALRYAREGNYIRSIGVSLYVISVLETAFAFAPGMDRGCVERHLLMLAASSMLYRKTLPTLLVWRYAKKYAGILDEAGLGRNTGWALLVDAASWMLLPLSLAALSEQPAYEKVSTVYKLAPSMGVAIILAEAAAVALVGYASMRASIAPSASSSNTESEAN
ncbi:MAG: S16 family serine protease [Thermoproteota archaeon]